MPTLVLDKSALRALNRNSLAELQQGFDFILPEVLLYEIMTEEFGKRSMLSAEELEKLNYLFAICHTLVSF